MTDFVMTDLAMIDFRNDRFCNGLVIFVSSIAQGCSAQDQVNDGVNDRNQAG